MALDPARQRLIAVAERKAAGDDHALPENLLVEIALAGPRRGEVRDLVTGRDFYAFPRLSPDGRHLVYLAWDLPDMPWDQSELLVSEIQGETIPVMASPARSFEAATFASEAF